MKNLKTNKMKQTAVEFLAERFNYITWLRNRDEISAGTADEWRAKFLKEAKEMQQLKIIDAYNQGCLDVLKDEMKRGEQYYNEKFNK